MVFYYFLGEDHSLFWKAIRDFFFCSSIKNLTSISYFESEFLNSKGSNSKASTYSFVALELIGQMCPNLERFSIRVEETMNFSGIDIVNMAKGLRKLKNLAVLSGGFMKFNFGMLTKHCPDLEQITFTNYMRPSFERGSIVCKLPKLKYAYLNINYNSFFRMVSLYYTDFETNGGQ